ALPAAAIDPGLTDSRFAQPPAPARLGSRINLGGLASAFALAALIGGLGYGGYALLQDLQRVGFAPMADAPEVVAEAPVIALPQTDTALLRRPDADAYRGDGVLAAIAPADLAPPPMAVRDGPISAIDPATTGVFATPASAAVLPDPDTVAALAAANDVAAAATELEAMPESIVAELPAGPPHVFVHATETAWIRVRDGDDAVIFQGVLAAGERFEVPERTIRPMLRAGNAGAVYLLVDTAAYGPLGGPGSVVKNLSLQAADIAQQIPQASAEALGVPAADAAMQRAEAVLAQ
ncbi:MAG TPA: DUF4115 domain-containing protein, partial [Thermohalobaculum sp.]|nr:DUF4115 domain-containing protein [Thermohalobaculum sp.]